MNTGTMTAALAGLMLACAATACSAEEPGKDAGAQPAASQPAAPAAPAAAEEKKDAAAAAPAAGGKMTAIERVNSAEKGTLKNPYDWKDQKIADEGYKLYMGASCNGCHGGGGGGGMCPPLTNETWVYGGDDDTLFRLITLGSDDLKKNYGLARKGQENVVGPMPSFKAILTDEDKLWKIIAFIRSKWGGRPEKIQW